MTCCANHDASPPSLHPGHHTIPTDLPELGAALDAGDATAAYATLINALTTLGPEAAARALMNGKSAPRIPGSAREAARILSWLLSIPKRDAAKLLGVSASRLSRNDTIDRRMLDRLQAFARTWARVSRALGKRDTAAWFKSPNPGLGGAAPLALFGTSYGYTKVDNLVTSLLHGGIA